MLNLHYLFHFLECGKFCINYILKKEKIKKKVTYNGQMMTLLLLKKVMKEYFNEVSCLFLDSLNLIGKKRVITLIKINKKVLHYVVIEKIENNYVYYYDPVFVLKRKKKIDKFNNKWSHYCCFYH